MKKTYFLMLFFCLSSTLYAQQKASLPPNLVTDQRIINGYVVKVIQAIPVGYGYDIFQNDKLLVHQIQNPLPFAPKGIQDSDDAYKIATWLIKDFQTTGQWSSSIPPHIARELKIKIY